MQGCGSVGSSFGLEQEYCTEKDGKLGEVGMSETREKRKVEFIESYWTGGEFGSDYKWNDNHGELIRCKDCVHYDEDGYCDIQWTTSGDNWFCGDGERK